jgi:tRNA threonylcarbamoyladenosine biosynthesis protein TsaE
MVKKMSLAWQNCSEEELKLKLAEWLGRTDLKDSILFLEGEMGAGKSTFVREILRILSPAAKSQGSPTFPLIQTYQINEKLPFYHIDLYRLKNESELADSGIEAQIEEEPAIVCVEWASLFSEAFSHWFAPMLPHKKKRVYLIRIVANGPDRRDYRIVEYP